MTTKYYLLTIYGKYYHQEKGAWASALGWMKQKVDYEVVKDFIILLPIAVLSCQHASYSVYYIYIWIYIWYTIHYSIHAPFNSLWIKTCMKLHSFPVHHLLLLITNRYDDPFTVTMPPVVNRGGFGPTSMWGECIPQGAAVTTEPAVQILLRMNLAIEDSEKSNSLWQIWTFEAKNKPYYTGSIGINFPKRCHQNLTPFIEFLNSVSILTPCYRYTLPSWGLCNLSPELFAEAAWNGLKKTKRLYTWPSLNPWRLILQRFASRCWF